jgi:hypothetical protein
MLPPETIAAVLLAERLPLTAYFASVTRDFHLAEDVFQEISVKAVGRAAGGGALNVRSRGPRRVRRWERKNERTDFVLPGFCRRPFPPRSFASYAINAPLSMKPFLLALLFSRSSHSGS